MGILDSILSDDFATLTDPDFFGESVSYTAVAAGASPVLIDALVLRDPLVANGGERTATRRVEIVVSADPRVGIPAKPARNQDTITVAWNLGDVPAAYLITEIVTQDTGGWHLKLKGK